MKTRPRNSKDARVPKLARILVPTDFSPNAAQALRYAVALARQVGGKITLLHVLDWPVVPTTLSRVVRNEDQLTRAAKAKLAELAGTTVPAELLGRTVARLGASYREIVRGASGLKMDLIVMATQGTTGLKRALLGSTAERVVRHAACPVLTLRRVAGTKSPGLKSATLAPRINRILVPVDFSSRSKATVQFASGLAQTMHARLALVHVVAPLATRSSRFRAEFKQHADETNQNAKKQLNTLAATVPAGIKVEVLLRQDIPHRGIVAAAKHWRSDLIVLPTRGLTGVKYVVLGSTAEAVVRHAACPVLTLGGKSPQL